MLLASDFDKTLFVDDDKMFQKNILKIKKWRENNLFVITTGRSIYSILPLIEKYKIPYDYLICENGATVFDSKNNMLESTYLEENDIEKITEIIKKNNLSYILDNGKEYTDNLTERKLTGIFIRKENIKNLTEIIKYLNEKTNTYHYLSSNYICIENSNVRKDKSLEELGKKLNVDQIYCIGDAVNDIEMINKFNGGIMKNHDKELNTLSNKEYKSLSDYIDELI